jgi:hypothetical protein
MKTGVNSKITSQILKLVLLYLVFPKALTNAFFKTNQHIFTKYPETSCGYDHMNNLTNPNLFQKALLQKHLTTLPFQRSCELIRAYFVEFSQLINQNKNQNEKIKPRFCDVAFGCFDTIKCTKFHT